ncbi:MAG TPA: LPS assembly lipoprotein LptE [Elusimicrobiota bacterium]|nr:LPS assembly lipoprotein LptE [Elusimicrobiota bacterium]
MKKFRPLLLVLAAVLCAACGSEGDVTYAPAPQILPSNVTKIAIRPIVNKTQQFGIEDKLYIAVRDAFLSNGQYPIVPESEANGAVYLTITRYLLIPIQYDVNLVPTAYKLTVIADLQFIDVKTNTALWDQPNIEEDLVFNADTRPGGLTEEQAREELWPRLANDVVTRVIQGFGSVTGATQRQISPNAPSTKPSVNPGAVPLTQPTTPTY